MNKPRLLDLFCCQGGAAMGYSRAGFDVVGVDIKPQPRYPFEFVLADALEYVRDHGHEFDAIHASPPCQAYSNTQKLQGNTHPDLIGSTREALIATGRPYVIENVLGAPLINPVLLRGEMFGLGTRRPRLFECSFDVPFVMCPQVPMRNAKMSRAPKANEMMQVVGHLSDVSAARRAMGIGWMTGDGLAQAIPPAYTQFIGEQLMQFAKVTP
jgi:DNA (cytosine-5)-methyltransferase 1